MYQPKHFQETDRATMLGLIDAFPLAAMVVSTEDGLEANHVPLLAVAGEGERLILRGHVARPNPLAALAAAGAPALAIFSAEQHYVSPGWYPSKREHGQVVPTWNYRVVHAHGRLQAINDAAWLRDLVEALTRRHERDLANPWQVGDAPADYLERMLRAIVGIELQVDRLEGKSKLSQNRSAADREGVVGAMERLGSDAAAAMADRIRGGR